MSKKQIIKYSGVAVFGVFFFVAAIISVAVSCVLFQSPDKLLKMLTVVFASISAITTIRAVQKLGIVSKILRGKYKIVSSKIYDIKQRNVTPSPYDDRILVLDKFKLAVSPVVAYRFSVGDVAVMVFVDNVKYPILIINQSEIKQEE